MPDLYLRLVGGTVNDLTGNDAPHWQAGNKTWNQVRYKGAYPCIELVFYGKRGELGFDFVDSQPAVPAT